MPENGYILPGPLQGEGPDPAVPAANAVYPQLPERPMDILPGPLQEGGPDPAVPAVYAVHPQLPERPA